MEAKKQVRQFVVLSALFLGINFAVLGLHISDFGQSSTADDFKGPRFTSTQEMSA